MNSVYKNYVPLRVILDGIEAGGATVYVQYDGDPHKDTGWYGIHAVPGEEVELTRTLNFRIVGADLDAG